MKLKTFTSMKQQMKVALENRECFLVAEHTLFSHKLFSASLKGYHLQDVLCWPLSPIRWAPVHYDGAKKTNKASLGKIYRLKLSTLMSFLLLLLQSLLELVLCRNLKQNILHLTMLHDICCFCASAVSLMQLSNM